MKALLIALLLAVPCHAASYYLSPTGDDSNSGTSAGSPWLTPNHPVNCGDTITAAPSTAYSPWSFHTGSWGTVTCAAGNNVAWLKCAVFDACKISTNSNQGMWIDQSYWGVQGFEVTVTSYIYGTCFLVRPNYNTPAQIHHIILANDVANGCTQGGFNTNPGGSASVDYVAFVGDIAYNSVSGSNSCTSAFSFYGPSNSDTLPGTHIYAAGNFAWENVEPSSCNGSAPTDGDGIIADTWSYLSYTGQGAFENNLVFLNGGYGYGITRNSVATIYLRNNTAWSDFNDPATGISFGGELNIYNSKNVNAQYDLIQSNVSTTARGNPIFALAVGEADTTSQVANEWLDGYNSNNVWDWGTTFNPGPNNTLSTSPVFSNPSNPGAPNCGSHASTTACMATTIANFKPTAAAAATLGYQQPSATPVYDTLFPQWLCNVNLPVGLVSTGCITTPTISLTPDKVTLTTSQTQTFTATVSGTSNTAVTWSLSPAIGSITAGGVYTAPTSITGPQTVTATATSVSDPAISASSTVLLVTPVSISLTPASVTLFPSQTQALTTTISGTSNTAVTWSLSPAMGSISSSGIYTAPASVSSLTTVTITATSAADTTKSASATVTVAPPPTISLTPGKVTLTTSQSQTFTATLSGTSNTVVTWSLSPSVGSITAGGVYTAPASITSPQTVTTTATSVADPAVSVSSTISLVTPVSVTLTPASVTLFPSQTQTLTASVSGTSNTAVTWSISPSIGSISSSGVYTAPATVSSPATVTVTATSAADTTKSASATVTVAPPPTISLTPGSVTLTTSQSQTFAATVSGTSNTAVTWSLSPAIGGITTGGVYTAPASITSPQTVTATATSAADPAVSAKSTVSLVTPVSVSLAPDSVTLFPSQAQTLTPTVSGTSNTAVTWSINPSIGSISSSGVYSAPATVLSPATVTVTATSVADTTKSASATVTVAPPPTISLTPGSVTLTTSQIQAFAPTISGSTNIAVTWSLSPAIGGITTGGVYTAPASIISPQTVTATATSVADPAVSVSSTISLVTPVSVSLTPASVTLFPSQTQTLTASVSGTSNTAVTWSISPATGSITASGVYTAPATISSPTTVTVTATSVVDTTKSASATVTLGTLVGASYYLATAAAGGNDSNNGLSASSPWLTPNHPLNCGDTITAAPSTAYSPWSFHTGSWGTVTCAAGNNVAWLKCAVFDACKISTNSNQGMWIDQSYWGVQGFEVTVTSYIYGTCFLVRPNYNTPVQIHHIILANDVANGCTQGGFNTVPGGSASVDYVAFVGDIAYNSVSGSNACASAFSFYEPSNSDTLPGTHIYAAGNFAWENVEPSVCNGTAPTDGTGIIADTWSYLSYTGQGAFENNLVFLNGGYGINVAFNHYAHVYIRQNTIWSDFNDSATGIGWGGELNLYDTLTTSAEYDLIQSTVSTTPLGNPIFALAVGEADTTSQVANEWLDGYNGNNIWDWGTTFTPGPNNTLNTSPVFSNPSNPGAPNCGSYASTTACMATTITNFKPTVAAAATLGYQQPSATPVYDTLFPQWLCNVNLPSGLVSMGCKTSP